MDQGPPRTKNRRTRDAYYTEFETALDHAVHTPTRHVFAICGINVPYTSVNRMSRPFDR
jgi:hypothetical protein